MVTESDGFIALPGGFGTLDEIADVIVGSQLNYPHKPIALININGFHDDLLRHFERMIHEGMAPRENKDLYRVVQKPADALNYCTATFHRRDLFSMPSQ